VGGNLFAPQPAGDVAVALLAVDATVKLVSARGERTLRLSDFYTGFMTTALAADELLAEIQVPLRWAGPPTSSAPQAANTPAVVTAQRTWFEGRSVRSARLGLNAVDLTDSSAHAEAALGWVHAGRESHRGGGAAGRRVRALRRLRRQRVVSRRWWASMSLGS